MIALPPLLADAANVTLAWPFPAEAVPIVGELGAVLFTLLNFDALGMPLTKAVTSTGPFGNPARADVVEVNPVSLNGVAGSDGNHLI